MTMSTELEKDVKQLPVEIVAPINVDRLAEAFRTFQEFKQRLLTKDDSITIAGRQYLKKSAWRKWALACGVSDEIVSFDHVPAQGKDQDGSFAYRVVVRAFHEKSGRCSAGVAVASKKEKNNWSHEEHDIFALAHTRAKNRAIADLVGGGEVSAEEMASEPPRETTTNEPAVTQEAPAEPWQPKVPALKDPSAVKGIRQLPLTEGTRSIGMINILNDNSEVSIVPEHPIPTERGPIKNFLIPRVLETMKQKHPKFDYQLQSDQGMLRAVFIRGNLDQDQIKDLANGARWAFQKATESQT